MALVGNRRALLRGVAAWWFAAYGSDVALAIDFAGNRAHNAGAASPDLAPASLLTTVRASTATYFDVNGVLQTAANNVLRLDYAPATGAPLGALIEEQRTNLLTASVAASGTGWETPTGLTVTTNFAVSPDGTVDADKINVTNSAANKIRHSAVTVTASTTYSFTFWAKAGTLATPKYSVYDLTHLADIVASTSYAAQINGTTFTRVTVTFTTPVGTTSIAVYMCRDSVGTGTVFSYGYQLEAGAFPTSYIPTTTAQVTRSVDQDSDANTKYPFSATAGTLNLVATTAPGASGNQVVAQVDDGTASNRIRIVRDSSSHVRCIVTSGGVEQANLDMGAVASSTLFKLAFAWQASDFAASLNGAAVVTAASGSLPSGLTTTRYGYSASGEQWDGHINALAYWTSRKSNAYLQQVTT